MLSIRRGIVLGWLLLALCAPGGCQPGQGLQGPAPADVALRPSDVQVKLSRCPYSGAIDGYLRWLRAHDPAGLGQAQDSWNALRKLGATGAEVTGYGAGPQDCAAGIGRAPQRGAATWVIASKDTQAAVAVYRHGVLGFPTPLAAREQQELVVGAPTGLGPDAWTMQLAKAPGIYIAWWRNRQFTVFLVTLGFDPAASHQMALAVDDRIS